MSKVSSHRDLLRASWRGMLRRCRNSKDQAWRWYGARGITVCERWTDFEVFISDMGPRPHGAGLDRIENNGNYCPENCRWATPTEQARNRRTNRILHIGGEAMPVAAAVERFGLNRDRLRTRLDNGWPDELAVFGPRLRGGPK